MKKPILLIMAAGLGSRYGGLKQIAPVDAAGHILIDYAIYDALRAGFERLVCVITPGLEADFHETIGERIAARMEVRYAYQLPDALPAGFSVPAGRVKPWGTAHAVLSAKDLIDAPFAVINADDFYGAAAFRVIYDFLASRADDTHHAMVGYRLENTLTENGQVARGVCRVDAAGRLLEVIERTHVVARPGGGAYTEDGQHFTFLPADTVVSMNMWGFGQRMMGEIERRFAGFLRENLAENSLNCEYFLPLVPNALLREGGSEIRVLPTEDKWYGVTYAADMPVVRGAIAQMITDGLYPQHLWGENA